MARNRPTHLVRHVNGWKARLYLNGDIVDALASRDTQVRDAAREYVYIRFRKVIWARYRRRPGPTEPPHWIEWDDIKLTPVEAAPPKLATSVPAGPPAKVTEMPPSPGKSFYDPHNEYDAECDECAVCEIGNHYQCPRCPNSRPGAD